MSPGIGIPHPNQPPEGATGFHAATTTTNSLLAADFDTVPRFGRASSIIGKLNTSRLLSGVLDTTLVELDLPQVQKQRKSKRNAEQQRADHWNP